MWPAGRTLPRPDQECNVSQPYLPRHNPVWLCPFGMVVALIQFFYYKTVAFVAIGALVVLKRIYKAPEGSLDGNP